VPLGLIGKKIGMGQMFDGGKVIPITLIEAGSCYVIQKKDIDRDGYKAIQLGYGELKKPNRPLRGHFEKTKVSPKCILRELRVENPDEFEIGEEIKIDIFKQGERIDITGISKGKGFSGGVKRWGFRGGRASRGSMFHRAPGSIGSCAIPSRVHKGKKLPGRMGNKRITTKKIEILKVDMDRNILIVKGPLPGHRGSLLLLKKTVN